MDIIKELYDRNLYFIVEDIFTFLDVKTIKKCFFVSYDWTENLRKYKIWKRFFNKKIKHNSKFELLSQVNGWHHLLNEQEHECETEGEREKYYEDICTKVSLVLGYSFTV